MAEPVCLVAEPGPIATGIQVDAHLGEPRRRLLTGSDRLTRANPDPTLGPR